MKTKHKTQESDKLIYKSYDETPYIILDIQFYDNIIYIITLHNKQKEINTYMFINIFLLIVIQWFIKCKSSNLIL